MTIWLVLALLDILCLCDARRAWRERDANWWSYALTFGVFTIGYAVDWWHR